MKLLGDSYAASGRLGTCNGCMGVTLVTLLLAWLSRIPKRQQTLSALVSESPPLSCPSLSVCLELPPGASTFCICFEPVP